MSEFNQNEYIKDYDKKTYKKMTFRLRKDEAEELSKFIKENTDLSLNGFIKLAVDEKVERLKKDKNNL